MESDPLCYNRMNAYRYNAFGERVSVFVAGPCTGVAAWDAKQSYSARDHVRYKGALYTAHWWNSHIEPATHAGPYQAWSQSGTCAGATATTGDGVYGRHRYFIYDRAGHLIGRYDNAGHLIKAHIWLNGRPIAVATPKAIDYVTTDQLGTPRVITNADQTIVWRWQSTPFGVGQPNNSLSGQSNRLSV